MFTGSCGDEFKGFFKHFSRTEIVWKYFIKIFLLTLRVPTIARRFKNIDFTVEGKHRWC